MLWWVLKLIKGVWWVEPPGKTTPSPQESATNPDIAKEEHLHLDSKGNVVGAEVMATSAPRSQTQAETLRQAYAQLPRGAKDAVFLYWYDNTETHIVNEESFIDVGVGSLLLHHGVPHEVLILHTIDDVFHAVRYRRIDHRTVDLPSFHAPESHKEKPAQGGK